MRASSRREIENLLEHTGWLQPLARSLVRDDSATDDSFEVLESDAFGRVTVARSQPAERIVVDVEECRV